MRPGRRPPEDPLEQEARAKLGTPPPAQPAPTPVPQAPQPAPMTPAAPSRPRQPRKPERWH